MSSSNKKESERHHLESFLRKLGTEIQIESIEDGNEPPDFVALTTSGKSISIELTQLIEPIIKKNEEIRSWIIKESERVFQEKYKVEFACIVRCFPMALSGTIQERTSLSNELVGIVEKLYQARETNDFQLSIEHPETKSSFYESVHIESPTGFVGWQHLGAHRSAIVTLDQIDEAIRRKEASIHSYDRPFDEKWLLFVVPFGRRSSAYTFDGLTFEGIKTEFDRVFAYRHLPDEVVSIK